MTLLTAVEYFGGKMMNLISQNLLKTIIVVAGIFLLFILQEVLKELYAGFKRKQASKIPSQDILLSKIKESIDEYNHSYYIRLHLSKRTLRKQEETLLKLLSSYLSQKYSFEQVKELLKRIQSEDLQEKIRNLKQ